MTAKYLARSADGIPLVGSEQGTVPLETADPSLASIEAGLRAAPGGLPDVTTATASPRPAEHTTFGSPIPKGGKLLGIGLNYADHASDLDETRPEEPASFFKPTTAATGPNGPIRLPSTELTDRVTAEAELAVVIGKTCSNVSEERADEVIAGYVPVIDMTAEDILRRNPRYLTRAKSFETFLVMGPRIVVPDDDSSVEDLSDVEIRTVVNDETVASNTVSNMRFSPRELVSFYSDTMRLELGDLISTGTPGAHVIEPGDTVRAEIDRIGSISADVVRS